jgi:hypothetical protein
MNDLAQLLKTAAPVPRRGPDVAAAVRRGRSRTRRRRAAGSLLLLALLAGGTLWTGALRLRPALDVEVAERPADAAAGGAFGLGVLDRPLGPRDGLPEWAAATPAATVLADPADARLAGRSGSRAFYAARGADGTLCLLMADEVTQATTGSCVTEKLFAARGHLPLEVVDLERPAIYAALVPDGVTSAQAGSGSADVTANLVLFDPVDPATLVVWLNAVGGRRHLPVWVDLSQHPRPVEHVRVQAQPAAIMSEAGGGPAPLPGTRTIGDRPSPERCAFLAEMIALGPSVTQARLAEQGYRVTWILVDRLAPLPDDPAEGFPVAVQERSGPPIGTIYDIIVASETDSGGEAGQLTVMVDALDDEPLPVCD